MAVSSINPRVSPPYHNKGSVSGSVTIDFNDGLFQRFEMTDDTTISFANIPSGVFFSSLIVSQDSTGGHSILFPIEVVFPIGIFLMNISQEGTTKFNFERIDGGGIGSAQFVATFFNIG